MVLCLGNINIADTYTWEKKIKKAYTSSCTFFYLAHAHWKRKKISHTTKLLEYV